jgi:hypothetical protein
MDMVAGVVLDIFTDGLSTLRALPNVQVSVALFNSAIGLRWAQRDAPAASIPPLAPSDFMPEGRTFLPHFLELATKSFGESHQNTTKSLLLITDIWPPNNDVTATDIQPLVARLRNLGWTTVAVGLETHTNGRFDPQTSLQGAQDALREAIHAD